MNSADKKRLLYLCAIAQKESMIIFEEKEAYINTQSYSVSVKLSEAISEAKIGISPQTIQSIISTMGGSDISIEKSDVFKYKFKSNGIQRIITVINAEYAPKVTLGEVVSRFTITNPNDLAKSISFASNFASKDSVLNTSNSFLKIRDNEIDSFATDGISMGYRKYAQRLPFEEEANLVISNSQTQPVIRALTDEGAKTAQIKIDERGAISFSTENCTSILARSSGEFRDFITMMNGVSAVDSNGKRKEDENHSEAPLEEIKSALSNINSMFDKNEYPFVDVHIYKDKLNLDSEVLTRGYDCLRASIPAKSTSEYAVRLSSILFSKAISKFKEARIHWRSSLDSKVNPLVIENGTEMVFFAPLNMPPKTDESYD